MSGTGLLSVDDVGSGAVARSDTRGRDVLAILRDGAMGFGLPVLWAFGHAFVGIEGDAKIYLGRALADLDPGGVGRDLMFANDGQSSFSLFRIVARTLAATLGFADTVALLSILAATIWFVAIVTFVRGFVRGRALVVVLAAVCVLPRVYTPWNLLGAGEGIAVPRPLAEACVLFALAALARERYLLAIGCTVAGMLVHPIMAAPGLAVLLVVLGRKDWRWLAVAAAVAAVVGLAGLLGAPLASRLFATIDPAWRAIVLERNPYLFLHLWPLDGFGLPIVQAATIVLGAGFMAPPVRRLLLIAASIGGLGCAAAFALGDGLGDLLALQAQLWRALWLPAALAPVAAGVCLWHLPRHGGAGQLTLAALSLAWLTVSDFPMGPIAALTALCIWYGARTIAVDRRIVIGAWIVTMVFGALSASSSFQVLRTILSRMPQGMDAGWTFAWMMGFAVVPVLLFVSAWRVRPDALAVRVGAPLIVVVATAILPFVWDVRTPARRDLDAATIKPDLVAMLAARRGEVLWLDGDEVWAWARRGNWNGLTQGGALIFSRDLALEWHRRTQTMVEHGLATRYWLDPWKNPATLKPLTLDPTAIRDFCRRADAPAWIVAPLEPGADAPMELDARVWSSGLPGWKFYVGAGDVRWLARERFAVLPCGGEPVGTL